MTQTDHAYCPVESIDGLEAHLRALLLAKNGLTQAFKDQKRSFALDGHLIGSIAEVLCSYMFGLKLSGNSTEQFDAITNCNGKLKVQIKISSTGSFRFKKTHLTESDNLLILLDLYDQCADAEKLISIRFLGTFEQFLKCNSRGPKNPEEKGYAAFKPKNCIYSSCVYNTLMLAVSPKPSWVEIPEICNEISPSI